MSVPISFASSQLEIEPCGTALLCNGNKIFANPQHDQDWDFFTTNKNSPEENTK